MGTSMRMEWNEKAIKDLLNSPELEAEIQKRVDAVRDTAASMYGATNYKGDVIHTDRCHGAVWAGDQYARRSCAKHNTLLKALDAGRE